MKVRPLLTGTVFWKYVFLVVRKRSMDVGLEEFLKQAPTLWFGSICLGKTEAATRGVLWKKVFLEYSQNSQENICARVSTLIKLQVSGMQLN